MLVLEARIDLVQTYLASRLHSEFLKIIHRLLAPGVRPAFLLSSTGAGISAADQCRLRHTPPKRAPEPGWQLRLRLLNRQPCPQRRLSVREISRDPADACEAGGRMSSDRGQQPPRLWKHCPRGDRVCFAGTMLRTD